MEHINQLIINKASSLIGMKEKSGNMGFLDKDFEDNMKDIGFDNGDAWCTLFVELVWKNAYAAYKSYMVTLLDAIFSESAVKTFSNFKLSKEFKNLVTHTPDPGALVFWQKYNNGLPDWRGHAGIFLQMSGGKMITIEGNTNDGGSRDGDGVYKKSRDLNYFNDNGLRLLGFVNPKI